MALDGAKRPVDAPVSNMGHLLGTGMLSEAESAAVAARLTHPSMSSGFGLRTMATTAAGYSPLSYHCGTVWPHDTAIAIHGLLRAGFHAAATQLADGLLAAGSAFDGRLPELYGGFAVDEMPVPVPYPAACRPQGWSAAAAVVMVGAFLGVEPDVPGGTVAVRPASGLGALRVSGLRIGGAELRVEIDRTGAVRAEAEGGRLQILARPATE
jgi:glycogen debranching enzyme